MDVFQNPLFRDLEKLNYSVNESKVYLTLIRLGASLAGRIATEAQLDRSSTYNALKGLIQRGVVSTVHKDKRTVYVPESPKKILDYYQEKEEIAKRLIPRLEEQFSFKRQKNSVKLFQGYKGLKTVFQDVLDSTEKGGSHLVMGKEDSFAKKMPYYFPMFRKRKEAKRIKTEVLAQDRGAKRREDTSTSSETESSATINIYDDKVAIVIWDEPPQAIVIENDGVRKTFEGYFRSMQKHTKVSRHISS